MENIDTLLDTWINDLYAEGIEFPFEDISLAHFCLSQDFFGGEYGE